MADNAHTEAEHIAAYLDGQLSDEDMRTMDHLIRSSPEVSARVSAVRAVVEGLRGIHATLPTPRAVALARKAFRHRRATLPGKSWYAQLLDTMADTLGDVMADLVYDGRSTLARAGYRSVASDFLLAYQSASSRIDLVVTKQATDAPHGWRLRGQYHNPAHDLDTLDAVVLTHDTCEEVERAPIDGFGRFRCDLDSGVYRVVICDRVCEPDSTAACIVSELHVGDEPHAASADEENTNNGGPTQTL